jgi:hypothetical protein
MNACRWTRRGRRTEERSTLHTLWALDSTPDGIAREVKLNYYTFGIGLSFIEALSMEEAKGCLRGRGVGDLRRRVRRTRAHWFEMRIVGQ